MSKTDAHINHTMLVWARKTVKLSTSLASEKLGISEEKLQQWEEGHEKPTIRDLYDIARIYKRPFSVFYFPEPPAHFKALKDFRKMQTDALVTESEEYDLQTELLLFQRKREIAIDFYEQLEIPVPHFSLKGSMKEAPSKLATRIINHLEINFDEIANLEPGYDALNYWKRLLENNGILVFQTSGLPLHAMRGACIAKDALPVIIINSSDTQNGRIFSLFHELVHIVLGNDGISNFRYKHQGVFDPIEIFCNQVAAEVLVPSDLLLDTYIVKTYIDYTNHIWSQSELDTLANLFCVSQEVILRRLLVLKRTNTANYEKFRSTFDSYKRKKSKGGDYYKNIIAKNGVLFLNLALQNYHENKLTSSSLHDYIQMKTSNLNKLEKTLYDKV